MSSATPSGGDHVRNGAGSPRTHGAAVHGAIAKMGQGVEGGFHCLARVIVARDRG